MKLPALFLLSYDKNRVHLLTKFALLLFYSKFIYYILVRIYKILPFHMQITVFSYRYIFNVFLKYTIF